MVPIILFLVLAPVAALQLQQPQWWNDTQVQMRENMEHRRNATRESWMQRRNLTRQRWINRMDRTMIRMNNSRNPREPSSEHLEEDAWKDNPRYASAEIANDESTAQLSSLVQDKSVVRRDILRWDANCQHTRGCDEGHRNLQRLFDKMDTVTTAYESGNSSTAYVAEDLACLQEIPRFFEYLNSLIHRRTFNSAWYKISHGQGLINKANLRRPPLGLSHALSKCTIRIADDDGDNQLTRTEFVDYIHSVGSVMEHMINPVTYDSHLVECWSGVLHGERKQVRGVKCN